MSGHKSISLLDELACRWRRQDEQVRRTLRRLESLIDLQRQERRTLLQALLDKASRIHELPTEGQGRPEAPIEPRRATVEIVRIPRRRHALLRVPGGGIGRLACSALEVLLRIADSPQGRLSAEDLCRDLGCSLPALKTRIWRLRAALLALGVEPASVRMRDLTVEADLDVRRGSLIR